MHFLTRTLFLGALLSLISGCGGASSSGPPSAPGWLTGIVVESRTQTAIAGATVELRSDEIHNAQATPIAKTTTGADGSYTLDPLSSHRGLASLRLVVHAPGWVPTSSPLGIPPESFDGPVPLGTQRLERGTPVTGVVLLPNGEPATTGEVYVLDKVSGDDSERLDRERQPIAAAIGEDGRFRVSAAGPQFALQADVPGHPPSFSEVFKTSAAKGETAPRIRLSGA